MKKIVGIILFFFVALISTTNLQAQTPFCAGIVVEAFPMDPQSGTQNHFGIRVKLDQTYDQNVTVSGYIYNIGESNTNHSFSVTVTSGDLTGETASNFYQTDPTASADVQVTTTSPSTLTNSGVTYSTGCVQSVIERLNIIGQLHNDYQVYLLTYLSNNNVDFKDTSNLKTVIQAKTYDFFQSKDIAVSSTFSIDFSKWGDDADDFSTSGFSTEGTTILTELKDLIATYDVNDDATFFTSLNDLQEQALSLSDLTEVYTVGTSVTIAIYSFNYWKSNGNTWITTFKNQEYNRTSVASTGPCDIKLKKIGGADVGGAIGGGRAGLLGGPGSAAAGAILGSATGSLYNLVNQVMDCYFSWWPF